MPKQLMHERVFSMLPEQKLHSAGAFGGGRLAVLDIELHVHMAAAGALLQLPQTLPGHSTEEATRTCCCSHAGQPGTWRVSWSETVFDAHRQWHSDRGRVTYQISIPGCWFREVATPS